VIDTIRVENFQSHVDSTIKLAPSGKVTAIRGATRNGKTAIFRAFRWIAYNIPPRQHNDGFIRADSRARVTVTMVDGRQVIREKGKSVNRYIVRSADGKEQKFEGFGISVPLEVQEILDVRPVTIGDTKLNLNLAEQLDTPFLGSKSMSSFTRAKVLGKLAGTEEVDFAAAQIKTDLYRRRAEEKTLIAQIKRQEENLAKYDYLENLGVTIGQVQELLLKVRADQERRDKLSSLNQNIKSVSLAITGTETTITEISDFLLKAEPLLSIVETEIELHGKFSGLAARYKEINSKIAEQDKILESTSRIRDAEILLEVNEIGVSDLSKMSQILVAYESVSSGLKRAVEAITITGQVDEALALVDKATGDFQLVSQLKSVSGRLEQVEVGIGQANQVLEGTKDVPAGLELVNSSLEADSRLGRLSALKSDREKINRALLKEELVLDATGKLGEAFDMYMNAEKIAGILSLAITLKKKQDALETAMIEVAAEIKRAEDDAIIAQNRYVATLTEMGVCEVCGSEISEENIRRVI